MDAAGPALCRALELDRKALDFYEAAREQSRSELGRRVFELLAEDKKRLATRLAEISAALGRGMSLANACALIEETREDVPGASEAVAALRAAALSPSAADLDLIGSALALEQACLSHLEGMLSAEADQGVRSVLQRALEEEKGHFVLVSDMRYYFETATEAGSGN